jgi:DNA-directed RNA polymerase subunit L
MKRIVSEKLGAKSDNYKFVEYPKELVGYYLYHPIEQKMFIYFKHVEFCRRNP